MKIVKLVRVLWKAPSWKAAHKKAIHKKVRQASSGSTYG